jgi:predicted O-methyltransferase YrrM
MPSAPRFAPPTPESAIRAYRRADEGGFGADGAGLSSRPGTGALLAVLAASRPGSRIAELGTGLGAGAAWLLQGMDAESRLVTVEADEGRAREAQTLLGSDPRIELLTGRAEDLLPSRGPFDLVFVDSGFSRELHTGEAADFLLDMVVTGGLLVLDDLTPELELELELEATGAPDAKREFAFGNPRVLGAELYPPNPDGTLGGVRSGLLVMAKRV